MQSESEPENLGQKLYRKLGEVTMKNTIKNIESHLITLYNYEPKLFNGGMSWMP